MQTIAVEKPTDSAAEASKGVPPLRQLSELSVGTPSSAKKSLTPRGVSKRVLDKEFHDNAKRATQDKYICKLSEVKTPGEIAAAEAAGHTVTDFGYGHMMRMDRYPLFPKKGQKNGDYGVPVAVSLLLKICAEGSRLFLVLGLISIVAMRDNYDRNLDRRQCRLVGGEPMGHAILTNASEWSFATSRSEAYAAVAADLGFPPEDCGWSGLPIRRFDRATVDGLYQTPSNVFLLSLAVGGCEEYRDCEVVNASQAELLDLDANTGLSDTHVCSPNILPRGPRWWIGNQETGEYTLPKLLVRTPTAKYCVGGDRMSSAIAVALGMFNIFLIIGFLIRIRYLAQAMAKHEDELRITPSDYSIAIDGLDTSVEPTQLRRNLRANVESLTFEGKAGHFADEIHHLEVGRNCREEIKVMQRVHKLDIHVNELNEKRKLKLAAGEKTTSQERGLEKCVAKLIELRAAMRVLIDEPDVATGHAYIAFKHELARNQFYMHFNQKSVAKGQSAAILECASPEAKKAAKDFEDDKNPCMRYASETFNHVMGFAGRSHGLKVTSAPEPREVNWQALELDDAHEAKVLLRGRVVIWSIIACGVMCLVVAKFGQFFYREESAETVTDEMTRRVISLLITCGVSGVTMFFNLLIRKSTAFFVEWEGQDTHTEAEASAFRKLSLGLGFNTVGVPVLVAIFLSNFGAGDQSWYEPGGVVTQMGILILCSWCNDFLLVFNMGPILAKHVYARFTYSPARLIDYWNPAPFKMGDSYAFCLVVFALGIIYGPLYPPAYFIVALGLTLKYMCIRFGLRHWFGIPPSVDQDMMMSLRWRLGQVLGISLVVQAWAFTHAAGANHQSVYYISIGGSIAIFLYMAIPLGYLPGMGRFDQLATTELDTGGLSFDDACEKRGLPMPHYICPTLAADDLDAREQDRFDRAMRALQQQQELTQQMIMSKGASSESNEDMLAARQDSTSAQRTRGGNFNIRYMHAVRTEDAIGRMAAILIDFGLPESAAKVRTPSMITGQRKEYDEESPSPPGKSPRAATDTMLKDMQAVSAADLGVAEAAQVNVEIGGDEPEPSPRLPEAVPSPPRSPPTSRPPSAADVPLSPTPSYPEHEELFVGKSPAEGAGAA